MNTIKLIYQESKELAEFEAREVLGFNEAVNVSLRRFKFTR
jgi:hypothetical protein